MRKDPLALKPRKLPVQARSATTVEALHAATIQVLTQQGLARCTTTRIAARAGASVGSLYQYYPNRDALLAAVLARKLSGVSAAVDLACRAQQGQPIAQMAVALTRAFLAAKLHNPDESKALYAVAAQRGGAALIAQAQASMVASIATMLASAADVHVANPAVTAEVALNTLVGSVRALLEGLMSPEVAATLETQLGALLTAYFQTHAVARAAASALARE